MAQIPDDLELPRNEWKDRLGFHPDGALAYHIRRIIAHGAEAIDEATQLLERRDLSPGTPRALNDATAVIETKQPFDVPRAVEELRERKFEVEVDQAVFSHGCGCTCCCGGVAGNPVFASPVFASPVFASPVFASPVFASPVFASPVFASPVFASPVFASRYRTSGARSSTAVPVHDVTRTAAGTAGDDSVRVVIFDTGIAEDAQLPDLIKAPHTGADSVELEGADENGDGDLDPAAGHGTFIAGIIEQIVTGCDVRAHRVLSTFGDGYVSDIAARITVLEQAGTFDKRTIVNMSFGTYGDPHMKALVDAIELIQATGAVVVASAGNDGLCAPQAPAALPEVIGVASAEGLGAAPYSNHGPWIRACAPGSDVISSFFADFDGTHEPPTGLDEDEFKAWASWTGTSFAGPIVAAALARFLAENPSATASDAVAAVIDDPALTRLPNLGTLVDISLS